MAAVQKSHYYPWVIGPWIDLLFICGGLVWILGLIEWGSRRLFFDNPLNFALPAVLVVAMYIFSNAHTAATWVRIGYSRANRDRFAFYSLVLLVPFLGLMVAGFRNQALAAAMAKLYILWVVQHYSAQVYGLTLIYLYKREYPLSRLFKGTLQAFFFLLAASKIVSEMTFQSWSSKNFILDLPFWGPLPTWIFVSVVSLATAAFVILVVQVLLIYLNREIWPPAGALLLTLSIIPFLILSNRFGQILWVYIPPFFHGSQYVLLSGMFHLRETGASASLPRAKAWRGFLTRQGLFYCVLVVTGGAVIYVIGPWAAERSGLDSNVALASIFAVANFHHFITDRAIWKLRDPKIRDILLA